MEITDASDSERYSLWKSMREFTIPGIKFYTLRISRSTLLPAISRFINKFFYNLGIGSVINRYDNSFTIYLATKDRQLYSKYLKEDIFCNFGSGAFFHKRWTNFDFPAISPYYKSLQGNIGKDFIPINLCDKDLKLPFENETVSLIYLSHTLEHLDKTSGINFLQESYRILKSNGAIRIVVPRNYNDFSNLRIISEQLNIPMTKKLDLASQTAIHLLASSSNWTSSKILDAISLNEYDPNKTYQYFTDEGLSIDFDSSNPSRHITYWGLEELFRISRELKFKAFLPSYIGSTTKAPFENLHVFDSTEPHISMYFEMIK